MTDRDRREVEGELRALGRALQLPAEPDVRAAVRARLAGEPRPTGRSARILAWPARIPQPRRPGPRRRLAVAVAVLTALAVFAATPPGQAAAAGLLRLFGVEFRQGSIPVEPKPAPLPGETAMSLDAARHRVPFRILVPRALGTPDVVTVSDSGRVVSLIYGAAPGRPKADAAGVAARLDEFDGTMNPVFQKFLQGGVEEVSVNGSPAAWVRGPHEVVYLDRQGEFRQQSARLAANTLIWQVGNVSLRLEGAFERDDALRVARSVASG